MYTENIILFKSYIFILFNIYFKIIFFVFLLFYKKKFDEM